MSRHEHADIIRRGYQDRAAGRVDEKLASADNDTLEARLYRTGLRDRGRDEFDGVVKTADLWKCPGCGWTGPKESLLSTDTGIKDNCPKCHAFCHGPGVLKVLDEIANADAPTSPATPPGYRPMSEAPNNGCPIAALADKGYEFKASWDLMAPHEEGKPDSFGWVEVRSRGAFGRPDCVVYHGEPLGWRPYPMDPVPGSKPASPESKPIPAASNATPSAYAEPEPGARKPRKTKPVDDNQGSLFR